MSGSWTVSNLEEVFLSHEFDRTGAPPGPLELSGGRSVQVNQQLIADNAGLAAEVAVAWAG